MGRREEHKSTDHARSVGRDDEDPLVGRVVDKYEVVRLIGSGGMGRVYEGAHTAIRKRVALKFIDRESATPEAVARFQREAQAASSIESPHIVEIFDVGTTDDGLPYIVMELLRGEDLGHRIRRLGRLEVPEALRVSAHVLRGLARAHNAGIVHRDLKPDNVFLVERDDEDFIAKVLDFGVSKIQKREDGASQTITREGVVLGTPVYMSPEQAQALPEVDGRSDIWSVGAILYECLTGRPPHSGASYEQVIVNICTRDVDDVRLHNPLVSSGLADVLKTALAREREERYGTARELLDALVAESDGTLPRSLSSPSDHLSNGSGKRTVIRPPSTPPPGSRTLAAVSTVADPVLSGSARAAVARRRSRRMYLWVGAAAISLGVLVAVGSFGMRGLGESRHVARGSTLPTIQINVKPDTPDVVVTPEPVDSAPPVASAATSAVAEPTMKPVSNAKVPGDGSRPIKPAPSGKPRTGAIGDGLQLKTK